MGKFVLTAQLNLQGPKNTAQIADQIKRQLGGVAVNVQVKNSAAAVRDLKRVSDATNDANDAVNKLGDAFGVSLKRFAAFSLASRVIGLFTRKLANAIDEAIEFDHTMVKIAQVTGSTTKDLAGLNKEITRLAITYGVASKEIAGVAITLAQAGLSAKDTKVALEALTKTSLAATFDDINETTEGAVALMAQFGEGAEALERQLSQVNTVAAKFAVESSDLIEVVRRTGGVFKSSGGQLEELLALFTSVRATTRENTESIATGLRNVFSRIQNPTTLAYLEKLGVSLTDVDEIGRKVFVGPFEAIKRLNAALKDTKPGDVKFIEIAKKLGGVLQIGKVIPLIQQFEVAERARQAALENGDSLTKDAATAQEALAIQLTKVREEFVALIREVTQSQGFQVLTKSVLGFASALIDVAEAIKPVLPLIGAFAAFKLVKGAGGFLGGVGSALTRRNKGGPIGFASGGLVPGSGNRDTVPAMLSPGEFVIRKSSVQKMGADNLHKMNKYAAGGEIKLRDGAIGGFFLNPENAQDTIKRVRSRTVGITNPNFLNTVGGAGGGKKGPVSQQKLAQFGAGLTDLERRELGLNLSPATRSQKDKATAITNKLRGQPDLVAKLTERYNQGLQNNELSAIKGDVPQFKITGGLAAMFPGKDELSRGPIAKAVSEQTENGLKNIIKSTIEQIRPLINVAPLDASESTAYNEAIKNLFSRGGSAQETIEGYINEGLISGITGAKLGGTGSTFDFNKESLNASRSKLGQLFGNSGDIGRLVKADAKRSVTESTLKNLYDKVAADINKGQKGDFGPGDGIERVIPAKFNKGGQVDFANMRLIDDITSNADGAKVPSPKNLARILKAQTAALDVDRTLFRTLGDKAYANAKTTKAKEEVLRRFFLNPATRLNDIKTAPLTGFGSQLLGAIKNGQVDPRNLSIISKSHPVSGLAEHISQLFGIPVKNMRFTSGGDKQAILDQMRKTGLGGSIRKKFAKGGAASDTVPALLTPGEFVMSRGASQRIGYGNLHRMNRGGVQGFADGGIVQKFAGGGPATKPRGGADVGSVGVLIGISALSGVVDQILGETTETNKIFKSFNSAISSGVVAFITFHQLLKGLGESNLLDKFRKKNEEEVKTKEESIKQEKIVQQEEKKKRKKIRQPGAAGLFSDNVEKLLEDERKNPLKDSIARKSLQPFKRDLDAQTRASQTKEKEQLEIITKQFEQEKAAKLRQPKGFQKVLGGIDSTITNIENKFAQASQKIDRAISRTLGKGVVDTATKVEKEASVAANKIKKAGNEVAVSMKQTGDKIDSAKKGFLSRVYGMANSLGPAISSLSLGIGIGVSTFLNSMRESTEQAMEKSVEDFNVSGIKSAISKQLDVGFWSDILSGALTGGGIGAAIGGIVGSIIPGLGTGIGALIGGGIGAGVGGGLAAGTKDGRAERQLKRRQELDTKAAVTASELFSQKQEKRISEFQKGQKGKFAGDTGVASMIAESRKQAVATLELARSGNVDKEKQQEIEEKTKSSLILMASAIGATASSEEQLVKQIDLLTGGMGELHNEAKKAALASKAATDVQKELTKANIDGLKLSSVFGAASLSVETMLGRLDDGVTELDSIISTIEAAQQNMLLGAEGRAAIDKARKAVFESINDDPENIATQAGKALSRQFTNLTALNDFNEAVGKVVSELDVTTDLAGQRAQLQQAISNAVGVIGDEETRSIIEKNIEKIFTANPDATMDEVIKKIQESVGSLSEPVKKIVTDLNNQNKVLNDLMRKRIEVEARYIEAQRQAIDLQIEAGRTIEEFGGEKFTPLKELSAISQRFNVIAANAGLSTIKGGAGDIRNVGAQINAVFSQLSGRALSGLAGGPKLSIEENARQDKLRQANTALIEFAKQRVELYKRELDIVQKKNDLEKSGLEKLIGGDVEGFIADTAASAAASVFRSGNVSGLKGLFSASTLAEAFKKVQTDSTVTDATKNAVARATLGAFGIRDSRAAGVLSGTTDEELRLKREARQTAATLGGLGQNAAEFARLDVQAREVIFTNASVTFQSERAAAARRLNRGGIVYANKGIFVPRGTDTVPAMLTPGEFVVRREAVQAGNNLQILKAMNANAQSIAKATPQHMSNGGSVQYLELGGVAGLNDFNAGFGANIDRLKNTNVNMQMAPATVVATLNAEALRAMSEQMQGNIIDAVISKLTQMKFNTAGEPTFRNTVLPNA